MKKTKTAPAKIVALVLTVCLLLAAFPLTVHAEPTAYDLWVGGTQVNAENCSDIPSVTSGHASFDPATNTLTLDGVRNVFGQTLRSAIYSRLDDLNIRLIGKNSLDYYYFEGSSFYERRRGILSTGNLTFSDGGEGSLGLYGFEEPIVAHGSSVTVESDVYLYINLYGPQMGGDIPPTAVTCGSLTVSGGELEIDGRYRDMTADISMLDYFGSWESEVLYGYADGISADSFTMTGGDVKITNAYNGVTAIQSLTVSGGKLNISAKDCCLYGINGIALGGMHTRLELNANNIAILAAGSIHLSDELSLLSPAGGSLGTWYGSPAVVNADGSGAKNVLIESKQSTVVDNVWLTMDMPAEGDSVSDIRASVKVAPEDEELYCISSLSFGEVLENGVDWGVETFAAGKTYLLDACVNTRDGITLLGGGTDTPPAYEDRFHAYVNDVEITHAAPAIYPTNASWLHYRFTVAPKYAITVNGGKAYDTVDFMTAEPVTAIASEKPAVIIPDPVAGKYVTSWTAAPAVDFIVNENGIAAFLMPDRDVTLTPVYADQTPVSYDLTGGAADIDPIVQSVLAMMYVPGFESFENNVEVDIDLDGDGTDDIGTTWTWDSEMSEERAAVHALAGTNLSGIYTIDEPNISPCSPIRFVFPRSGSETATVLIDTGAHGANITVEVPTGTRFFEAMDNAGVFDALNAMEDENCIFRDLASKPLAAFADEEEYGEDAGALLDTTVTSDMVVYAGFYQKIKTVSLTLTPPVAGTQVTVNDGIQTPAPVIQTERGAHYSLYSDPEQQTPQWFTVNGEGHYLTFEGTFAEGETYHTDILLDPDFGYWLDVDTVVTVKGAAVEEVSGGMSLYVLCAAQPIALILGDANGDGKVSIRDVTAIQRHVAEFAPLTGAALTAADVNGDGVMTIDDATALQRYLAEYASAYPIGTRI